MPIVNQPGYSETYKNLPWYYLIDIVCPRCSESFTLTESDFTVQPTTAGNAGNSTLHNLNWSKYNGSGTYTSGALYDPMYITGPCYNCGYWPIRKDSPSGTGPFDSGTDANYPLVIFVPPNTTNIYAIRFVEWILPIGITIIVGIYMDINNNYYPSTSGGDYVYSIQQHLDNNKVEPVCYDIGVDFSLALTHRNLSIADARLQDWFLCYFVEAHGIMIVESIDDVH